MFFFVPILDANIPSGIAYMYICIFVHGVSINNNHQDHLYTAIKLKRTIQSDQILFFIHFLLFFSLVREECSFAIMMTI